MYEERLFRMPTGYQLTVKLTEAGWWTLTADKLHAGEPWTERDRIVCERLSLDEAIDVLLSILYEA